MSVSDKSVSADSSDELRLDDLRRGVVKVLRQGRGSSPDVLLLEYQGDSLVLKDFNACGRWFALLLGAWLCSREWRTLSRLTGVTGVPAVVRKIGNRALLMQAVDAEPVSDAEQCEDWSVWFEDLKRLIDEMHAHGVVHCDLRSPGNTLIDAANRAWIVDFTGSLRRSLLNGWLFRQLKWADESAVIKIKRRVAPELISADENAREAQGHPLERPARAIGSGTRRLIRGLLVR